MITYKPIIIPGGRRKDGTWPVKIRVTFKGVSRRLPTTLVCTDQDLTRSGKIKNATIIEKAGELITRMRETTAGLSPFTLEAWDVDQVVDYIKGQLSAQQFRLEFFSFAEGVIADKIPHTRAYYGTALNAFAAFLGKREIDVNAITRRMLLEFVDSVGEQKAARHIAKLSYLFREARDRFNDEDAGVIRIPRQPFTGMPKIKPMGKGQDALEPEVMQRLIDIVPENRLEEITLAVFFLSLATAGANMADLYREKRPISGVWKYNRAKTGIYVETAINRIADTFVGILQEDGPEGWWLPALHRWGTADTATHNVNKWLRRIAEREGMEPFTFYAARHTWGTMTRDMGIEKATIDDAMAHRGEFQMADIYAKKNFALGWEANNKVLAVFSWGESDPAQIRR